MRSTFKTFLCGSAIFGLTVSTEAKEYLSGIKWEEPAVVRPGDDPGAAPSDAIVLFDGNNLDAWTNAENWEIVDGAAVPRKGGLVTKQPFGDIQLHVEWATPAEVKGSGQGRGNSGVYLMGKYEVQVLDSYENETYFDGQAGSLYKQWPPLVNASRPPGEWQTYDIVFTAPRFNEDGSLVRPAFATVLHNGVLVQNHSELSGGTSWDSAPEYKKHPTKLPLTLQFHGNPVKFRNIWVRELTDRNPVYPDKPTKSVKKPSGDKDAAKTDAGEKKMKREKEESRNAAEKVQAHDQEETPTSRRLQPHNAETTEETEAK